MIDPTMLARLIVEDREVALVAVRAGRTLATPLNIAFMASLDVGDRARNRGLVTWTDGEPWSIRVVGCGGSCL
jgi:hypothetical protein